MKRQRRSLLGPLLDQVPPGFLVDARWLAANGMDASSVRGYVDRGWLERLVRGVYRRPLRGGGAGQRIVPWKTALLSLQWVMKYDVHMGGRSAIDLLSFASLPDHSVHIYGDTPAWLSRVPTDRPFTVHGRRHFKDDETGILETARDPDWSLLMTKWLWQMKASSCERALLEVLVDLRSAADFDDVDIIFRSVTLVSPPSHDGSPRGLSKHKAAAAILRLRGSPSARLSETHRQERDRPRFRTTDPDQGRKHPPAIPHHGADEIRQTDKRVSVRTSLATAHLGGGPPAPRPVSRSMPAPARAS